MKPVLLSKKGGLKKTEERTRCLWLLQCRNLLLDPLLAEPDDIWWAGELEQRLREDAERRRLERLRAIEGRFPKRSRKQRREDYR